MTTRRRLLLGVACLVATMFANVAAAAEKPNVLLLVADDLNTNLGCYGHALVKTPRLDRLAKRGLLFERAYCQNPVCNPSRTSFLSGRRWGSRVKEAVFLPNHFRSHGYFTAEMGKLTHSYGITATSVTWDVEERRAAAQRLAALIARSRKDAKPFFVGVGLTHTHPGYSYRSEFLKLYPSEKIVFPKEPPDFRGSMPAKAYEGISVRQLPDDERRKHIAKYYASISTMDEQVGELLDTLDRLRVRENTVVIFTSDHGRHLGEHGGIYDKRTLFEASARVPLLVAVPGKRAGVKSARLVELVDLFPTLCELCAIPKPQGLEGASFVPLLDDPDRQWKTAAFTVTRTGGRSVRTARYRYAEWDQGDSALLFDYQTDPGETKNHVNHPQYTTTVAEMKRHLNGGWRAALPKTHERSEDH